MYTTENLTWHETEITKLERQKMMGHASFVIWLTGLSGAGKSTVANALEKDLLYRGIHTYLLDGDNLRMGINSNLGFSEQERRENIRRVAETAKLFVDAGIVVIAAVISPMQKDRHMAKRKFGKNEFFEVFVDCPIEICQERDPKGLYQKALNEEIAKFTGISAPYEPPVRPDITVQTHRLSVDRCVEKIIEELQARGVL